MSTSKTTTQSKPVTREQALVRKDARIGAQEQPLLVTELRTYGNARMSVTLEPDFGYWVRFSQESAELHAYMQAQGWRFSDSRRKAWTRKADAQSERTWRTLADVQAPAQEKPQAGKGKGGLKSRTQAQAPAQESAPTQATQDRKAAMAQLSDKALATLLAEVSEEITRRAQARK